MKYNELISHLMPLVRGASDIPCLIWRDNGEWNLDYINLPKEKAAAYLGEVRAKDPHVVEFVGKDLSGRSQSFVHDKVLAMRLQAEYLGIPLGEANIGELHAIVNFFEDNFASFPSGVTEYLAQCDSFLTTLDGMIPMSLCDDDSPFGYADEELADVAIAHIEKAVSDRLTVNTDKSSPEQTDLDGYIEKDSVQIAGLKIVLAENPNAGSPYLVYNCAFDNPLGAEEQYHRSAFPGYLSAMREFITRQSILLDTLETERRESGLPFQTLTAADCIAGGHDVDWVGKVLVVKPELLASEYRSAEHQYVLCTGGFGSKPDANGTKVYVKELHSGKECHYRRHNIAGIADPAKMPVWAIVKIKAHEIAQSPNGILTDGTFMFGGYIFTPYRKYEKRDGDFHAQMRRMRTDRELGLSTYDWQKHEYSYAAFYTASGNCEADIFKCWENGKLYVPGENELFCYNEPPQKTIRRTQPKPEKSSLLGKLDDNKQKVERDKAAVKVQPATHKRRPTEVTD